MGEDSGADGALDGTQDGNLDGNGGDGSADGGDGGDGGQRTVMSVGGNCLAAGVACTSADQCCSLDCTGGTCGASLCVPDGEACTTGGTACCSGGCAAGKCLSLHPPPGGGGDGGVTGDGGDAGGGVTCKTLGNHCATNGDCCSTLCKGGTCVNSSFCAQANDVCTVGTDCCSGVCNGASATIHGTCGAPPAGPANCTVTDGMVCPMSEVGVCGGSCCSRLCAPFAPTGVFICQPATGCHVVGDLCRGDSDCCDGQCTIDSGAKLGICRNVTAADGGNACKPDGDVCKLQTASCNETADCCSGHVTPGPPDRACKPDRLGVPRCAPVDCVAAGTECASSASCCDGAPCVPNAAGKLTCSAMKCIPTTGACTTSADCCPGGVCITEPGAVHGTCNPVTLPHPDGGVPDASPVDGAADAKPDAPPPPPPDAGACALYGQTCATNADCCDGVPCTNGFCIVPPLR
jgi:hypothetical protein